MRTRGLSVYGWIIWRRVGRHKSAECTAARVRDEMSLVRRESPRSVMSSTFPGPTEIRHS